MGATSSSVPSPAKPAQRRPVPCPRRNRRQPTPAEEVLQVLAGLGGASLAVGAGLFGFQDLVRGLAQQLAPVGLVIVIGSLMIGGFTAGYTIAALGRRNHDGDT